MKIRAFLQRLVISSDLKDLAEKYRKDASIPEDGFGSFSEFEIWSSCYSEDEVLENFNGFVVEALKIVPYKDVLSYRGIKKIFFEYYFFLREFDVDTFSEEYKTDLFEIISVDGVYKNNIQKGVYVRIPFGSGMSEIKDFVNNSYQEINKAQKSLRAIDTPEPNIGNWREYDRDKAIATLNIFSADVISEYFGIETIAGEYKHQLIARALRQDSKFSDIKSDAVDKIIKRYNRRKRWLRDIQKSI